MNRYFNIKSRGAEVGPGTFPSKANALLPSYTGPRDQTLTFFHESYSIIKEKLKFYPC